jgi:hypothetical protein
MQLEDGREKLLSFTLPLDVTLISTLMQAIGAAAHRLGYTDIHMVHDGPNRAAILATRPRATVTPIRPDRNDQRIPGEE